MPSSPADLSQRTSSCSEFYFFLLQKNVLCPCVPYNLLQEAGLTAAEPSLMWTDEILQSLTVSNLDLTNGSCFLSQEFPRRDHKCVFQKDLHDPCEQYTILGWTAMKTEVKLHSCGPITMSGDEKTPTSLRPAHSPLLMCFREFSSNK